MKFLNLICLTCITLPLFSQNSPLSISGMKETSFKETEFNIESLIEDQENYKVEDVSFSVKGIKQYSLISTPKSTKPTNGYPVIILIHGHIPPEQYSTINSYKYMFNRFKVSEFVTIKPDLRGHGRSDQGEDFDINLAKLHYTQDILGLLNGIKQSEDLDYNNIYILGHSNGGDIALRVMSVKPDLIKAATLWAPVSVKLEESNFFYKGRGRYNYGQDAVTDPKAVNDIIEIGKKLDLSLLKAGIKNREDIRYNTSLKDIKTPIIIRHPDTDETVPYAWSVEFIKRYKDSGNKQPIELINYPGDDHNIAKHQKEAQLDDLKWFRGILK